MSVQTAPTPPVHTSNGDGNGNWHANSRGEALSAISRRVVALLKEYNGKGPVKIRTHFWSDLLVVLMSGGYTRVENTLLQEGHAEAVRRQRAAFQQVMVPRFIRVIEQELGREVLACMQANHHDPDYTAEVFVLAPRAERRPESDDKDETALEGGARA
jgi:uncharacterized protein YbcI